jgi:hypothetical protein
MTLDGLPIAYIEPGMRPAEVECVADWVCGFQEEGLTSEAIRAQARLLYTDRWARIWGRAWGHAGTGTETLAAIHSRVVDILLARPRPDHGTD